MEKEKEKVKAVAPQPAQLIKRDLGKYGGDSGVNKLYYLLCAVDNTIQHLGEDVVILAVNKKLEKYREFEKKHNEPTIATRIKSWADLSRKLALLRPALSNIQMYYDDIRKKNLRSDGQNKDKTQDKAVRDYRQYAMRVSPYQPELYFIYNLVMEISDLQRTTIPNEAFRTLQQNQMTKTPFDRPKPITPDVSEGGN